jgi:conjugal transfer/entry exclusion protein
MSDIKKIEAATGKLQGLLDWAKQNTMLAGIVITVLPAIASGGYITITKANEIIAMYNDFSNVADNASSAKRKAEAIEAKLLDKIGVLEDKQSEMRDTIAKLQDRASDATINAREAKIMAESTQKELRSGLSAQKTELDVTSSTLRSEMNTLKRATTNRLGQ